MSNFWKRLKQVGPGAVVAAAFIGPGTVTTCTVSGASYGYTLLWALLFSTISVIVLQSMASKLGIVKKVGLGEALREKYTGKGVRILLAILVIGAVFIGNVAYETGNISGGILGLQAIWPTLGKIPVAIFVFAVAAGLLLSGKYDIQLGRSAQGPLRAPGAPDEPGLVLCDRPHRHHRRALQHLPARLLLRQEVGP